MGKESRLSRAILFFKRFLFYLKKIIVKLVTLVGYYLKIELLSYGEEVGLYNRLHSTERNFEFQIQKRYHLHTIGPLPCLKIEIKIFFSALKVT